LYKTANEYELLCRLAKGDREAFDALYRQYFNAVYYNALKITRNVTIAEDILQEVFIALWEKRETINTDHSVGGWLFIVCYNKSINILKKQLKESVAYSKIPVPDTENLKEKHLQELQWEILENAMGTLSVQKRKVFELCKLQGKTYEETAEVLKISKYTVKEYLSAATVSIKEYVQRHPDASLAASACLLIAMIS
jgi:RNA polymerase sigma-70 factor (ECF subfamily)